jgi:hypothetical protein
VADLKMQTPDGAYCMRQSMVFLDKPTIYSSVLQGILAPNFGKKAPPILVALGQNYPDDRQALRPGNLKGGHVCGFACSAN